MVRFIVESALTRDSSGNQLVYAEGFCLSTDTKPVGDFITGSTMTEVDTGDIYMYDEDASAGSEWVFEMSLQG